MGSLERLAALQSSRIYPGHGPVICEPGQWLQQYITHRNAREKQVRSSVCC
jgi:endoribonuclease LACTB2